MSFTFAQLFLAALCFYFIVHSVTCLAEIYHLKHTINEVPAPLKEKISLAQHRKAAKYDIARTKLNWCEVSVSTLLIVALTAGNGINAISDQLMDTVGDQFAFHWMLPAVVALIFVLVDLPFCWYKEFRLREAFGYTRQTRKTWFKNFVSLTVMGWLAVLPLIWIGLFLWQESGSHWWFWGWLIFSIYLIFSQGLARRLAYFFKPSRGTAADDEAVLGALRNLSERCGITFGQIWVAAARDNEALPPAFAFGHRQSVRLIFRNDIYKRMTPENLKAIAAHALARNLSHMYFQVWLLSSIAGLLVFLFLAWFAPQSWFLDEIGFRVYGPGPYYGSLLTFVIVALPVLLFPFRLPMAWFLRHLIFLSDKYAMRYTGLKTTVQALIELTPTPMRHSSVTLGFFDLLFSHEPSLMARIRFVQKCNVRLLKSEQNAALHQEELEKTQQLENVQAAVKEQLRRQRVIEKSAQNARRIFESRRYEENLAKQAAEASYDREHLMLKAYQDPDWQDAIKDSEINNSTHPLYGKSLYFGLRCAMEIIGARLKALSKKHVDTNHASPEKTREQTHS